MNGTPALSAHKNVKLSFLVCHDLAISVTLIVSMLIGLHGLHLLCMFFVTCQSLCVSKRNIDHDGCTFIHSLHPGTQQRSVGVFQKLG